MHFTQPGTMKMRKRYSRMCSNEWRMSEGERGRENRDASPASEISWWAPWGGSALMMPGPRGRLRSCGWREGLAGMRLFHDAAGRGIGGCRLSSRAPQGRVRKALELRPQDGPSVGCQLGESALSPHWARPRDGGASGEEVTT